jgi:hypothetical protein
MGRGGRREGAGGKPAWNKGKTKVIRVPEALADKILEIARILDADSPMNGVTSSDNDAVTDSKVIDLSGITVRAFSHGPGIYLVDLIKAGYEIKPEALALTVKRRSNGDNKEVLKREVDEAMRQLSLKLDNP